MSFQSNQINSKHKTMGEYWLQGVKTRKPLALIKALNCAQPVNEYKDYQFHHNSSLITLASKVLFEAPRSFQNILPVTESTCSDKSFSTRSKTTSWCGNYVGFLQNFRKHIPRTLSWKLNPYVWSILPTERLETQRLKSFYKYFCVVLVECHSFMHGLQVKSHISAMP